MCIGSYFPGLIPVKEGIRDMWLQTKPKGLFMIEGREAAFLDPDYGL
jgi:hypothetical protein